MKYEPALVLLVLGCVFLSGCIDGGMPQTPPPYFNVNYYLNGTNETLKIYVKNNTNLNYVIYGNEGFFDYLQANNFTGGLIDTTYGYFQIVDINNATMDVAYIGVLNATNGTFVTIRGQRLYINGSIYGADITVDNVYAGTLTGTLDASYIDNAPWLLENDQRYNDTILILGINTTINSRIDNLTLNGPWVLKAGDNMTGNLNMTNNNITDVDYLYVHNISGRSPIHILSDVISVNDITASTFYGNFSGENGTIFGVSINNGTIVNLRVTNRALFNTSLIPELNYTWSLGEPDRIWRNIYVGNLFANNITSPNINQYYADQVWIYRTPYGNTTDYIFYFNETKLNKTIINISKIISFSLLTQVNVTGGKGTAITPVIGYMITQIIVTPTTPTNTYKFAAFEYPLTTNIIDRDLATHKGTWNIIKSYSLNSAVQLNITNSNNDEIFNVTIKYLNNAVE